MNSGRHFDPQATQCLMADKSTASLLFPISKEHICPIEHMDINNAYFHKPYQYIKPIYFKDLPNSVGQYPHGQLVGRLRKNLWGGNSVGYYYIKVLFTFLDKQGYYQCDTEPCLIST